MTLEILLWTNVPLAQWLERRSYEPDVAGSNPAWNILGSTVKRLCIKNVNFVYIRPAVWSSGMILRLGRRGRRFESANGPFFQLLKL